MAIHKSLISRIEEFYIAVTYEELRLFYFQNLDNGSSAYSERIADIEGRLNFYKMRIEEGS